LSNQEETGKPESYGGKVAIGAAFLVGTRFAVRLLGLVSVTILARLLTPEDFGVFGTAALALSFFILLKDIGLGEALVRTQDITRQDIDTLWTLGFITALVTAFLVFILAEPIAAFLKEPRIVEILHLMALIPIIDSFYSPASNLMVKDFKFAHIFILRSVDKFVRVIAVIILALILKSYWALVYGALMASVFCVIVSHIAGPYMPRFTLVSRQKYLSFAFWTYWRSLARYIAITSDEFIVRASESSAFYGIYRVSRDLTRVLIVELISPIREALLPALVQFSGDRQRTANAVYNIVGIYLIGGISITLGIIAISDHLVLLLLGPQWTQASYYLTLIAVGAACNSMAEINQSIFVSQNIAKQVAFFWGIRAVCYSLACLAGWTIGGAVGVAIAFSVISFILLIIELRFLFRFIASDRQWPRLFIRPIISGIAMFYIVSLWPENLIFPLALLTISKALVGAVVYFSSLLILWVGAGRPEGPELTIIERLPSRIHRILL